MSEFINHNFERMFDIEENTTVSTIPQSTIVSNDPCNVYDSKDIEIELQYQSIYEAAMYAYDAQIMNIEKGSMDSTPPRTLEVANQYLQTALDSIKAKADLKKSKDKIVNVKNVNNGNVTNNNIIMDRNELLKMMLKSD